MSFVGLVDKRGSIVLTSILRYPVFVQQNNYTGSNPRLESHSMLLKMAMAYMEEELLAIPSALLIP